MNDERKLMVLKIVFLTFLCAVILLLSFLYWAHLPKPSEHESYMDNSCSPADTGEGLKVITYNIAYGHGPTDDAGAMADKKTVELYLNRIADLIIEKKADIVLLQEVDLASKRTGYVDEAKYLSDKTGLQCYACVTTWKNNYIPFPYWPPSKHLGRMKSGQCVLSRFPILDNERVSLPQRKDKPFFYTAFYLDRAVQVVKVSIADKVYDIFNVHLEAFDAKNKEEQASILARLVSDTKGENIIVGGDFNALPSHATIKKDFPDKPETQWSEWQDVTSDKTMEKFTNSVPHLESVISNATPEDQTFTFPSTQPSRRIDYIFFSKGLTLKGGRVLSEAVQMSDHLPVYAEFNSKEKLF